MVGAKGEGAREQVQVLGVEMKIYVSRAGERGGGLGRGEKNSAEPKRPEDTSPSLVPSPPQSNKNLKWAFSSFSIKKKGEIKNQKHRSSSFYS